MCAHLTDFDSLVCREQVCALFTQPFNCCLPFLASYSAPKGYLIIESIGAMMNGQVLYGTFKSWPRRGKLYLLKLYPIRL